MLSGVSRSTANRQANNQVNMSHSIYWETRKKLLFWLPVRPRELIQPLSAWKSNKEKYG